MAPTFLAQNLPIQKDGLVNDLENHQKTNEVMSPVILGITPDINTSGDSYSVENSCEYMHIKIIKHQQYCNIVSK
jgi:hypothetical protein